MEINGSSWYLSVKPFLDISIACSIGFQLSNGFSHSGNDANEKKTPLVKYKGLRKTINIGLNKLNLCPALININPIPMPIIVVLKKQIPISARLFINHIF